MRLSSSKCVRNISVVQFQMEVPFLYSVFLFTGAPRSIGLALIQALRLSAPRSFTNWRKSDRLHNLKIQQCLGARSPDNSTIVICADQTGVKLPCPLHQGRNCKFYQVPCSIHSFDVKYLNNKSRISS